MTKDNETLLLDKIADLINLYNKWNLYPYELYTLMTNVSINLGLFYDLKTHKKLLRRVEYEKQ